MTPDHIIVHHSLTKDSRTVSWDAIRRYHIDVNGWNDIGYHWGIELINGHYEILAGRMMTEQGAHCRSQGMNRHSLGVCLIGNFDIDDMPQPQFDTAVKFVRSLCSVFSIPKERVLGHSEVAQDGRTCPGNYLIMSGFRLAL